MTKAIDFSFGCHYGDYSGVIFYGPPTDGFWLDRLEISDRFIDPLFLGMQGKASRESMPRLASEWNMLEGWATVGGTRVPVRPEDATEFISALAKLGPADVAEHCEGCTVEECLSCAAVVREFVGSRLAREVHLFIEDC